MKVIYKLLILTIFAIPLFGCENHDLGKHYFYVINFNEGYGVAVNNRNSANPLVISKEFGKPEDAATLANILNRDMGEDWFEYHNMP